MKLTHISLLGSITHSQCVTNQSKMKYMFLEEALAIYIPGHRVSL